VQLTQQCAEATIARQLNDHIPGHLSVAPGYQQRPDPLLGEHGSKQFLTIRIV
jgi:hypothetical protein